jgi:hypothetical protein
MHHLIPYHSTGSSDFPPASQLFDEAHVIHIMSATKIRPLPNLARTIDQSEEPRWKKDLAPHSRIPEASTEVPPHQRQDRTGVVSFHSYLSTPEYTISTPRLPSHAMPFKASSSNTNAPSPRCKCHNSQRRKMPHISFPACMCTNTSTHPLSITLSLSVLIFNDMIC